MTTDESIARRRAGPTAAPGADPGPGTETNPAAGPKGWTIAFRNPHASRFTRVAGLDLTWHQAVALAGVYGHLHPEQQVYYMSNAKAEAEGRVAAEDRGNILAGTGRRVKVTDREVPGVAELTETAAPPGGITTGDKIRIPGRGLSLTVTETVFYPAAGLVYAAEVRPAGPGAKSIVQVLLTPAEYAAALTAARGYAPAPPPDFPYNLADGVPVAAAVPRPAAEPGAGQRENTLTTPVQPCPAGLRFPPRRSGRGLHRRSR